MYWRGVINQIKKRSLSFKKMHLFVNKKWVLVSDGKNKETLIFKENGKLILSENGSAKIGSWEYMHESKTLLIDRVSSKILLNEEYLDEAIMIFREDKFEDVFYCYKNEEVCIQPKSIIEYLDEMRIHISNIRFIELESGEFLEVLIREDKSRYKVGDFVSFNAKPVKDGYYKIKGKRLHLKIKDSKIAKKMKERTYTSQDGKQINILQKSSWSIKKGDFVYSTEFEYITDLIQLTNHKSLKVIDGEIEKIYRGI